MAPPTSSMPHSLHSALVIWLLVLALKNNDLFLLVPQPKSKISASRKLSLKVRVKKRSLCKFTNFFWEGVSEHLCVFNAIQSYIKSLI